MSEARLGGSRRMPATGGAEAERGHHVTRDMSVHGVDAECCCGAVTAADRLFFRGSVTE